MGISLAKDDVSFQDVDSAAIDDEINSTFKIYEADQKRLTSILKTLAEKKHLSDDEESER